MILSTASSHFTAEPIQPQRWLYPRTATKVALGLATIRTIRIAFQWRQELVQDSYLHSGNLQDAQPVHQADGYSETAKQWPIPGPISRKTSTDKVQSYSERSRDATDAMLTRKLSAFWVAAPPRPTPIPVLVGSYGSERTQPSFPRWRRGPETIYS